MAVSNELEIMSSVFDLLGSSRLAPPPSPPSPSAAGAVSVGNDNHDEGVHAPQQPSDRELEKWVLGSQADPSETMSEGAGNGYMYPPYNPQFTAMSHAVPNDGYDVPPPPGHTHHEATRAEELSVALVEAQFRNAQKDTIIAEQEAILKKVRSVKIDQLKEAIALLQEEEHLRQKRCAAIAAQIKSLDAKKEQVILGYSEQGADIIGDSSGTVGSGAGLSRRPPPEVVFSYDVSKNMQRGQHSPKHKKRQDPSPSAIPVACGPLTKKDVDSHFNRYWESQRFRRMMSAQDRARHAGAL